MIAWKILSLLAFTHFILGEPAEDLAKFNELINCYQKAILHGIPDIGLPSYNPLKVSQNLSFSGPILDANISVGIYDIINYGLPHFEIRALDQSGKDTDSFANFDYDIHWDSVNISMEYDLEYDTGLMKYNYNGQVYLYGADIDWIGYINFEKPSTTGYGALVGFLLNWEIYNLDAKVVGLGEFDDWAAGLISSTIKTSLNYMYTFDFEDALRMRLNEFWFTNTTRMDILQEWCENN